MWCPINSQTWVEIIIEQIFRNSYMKYFFAHTVSKLAQFAHFSSRNIPSKWELLIISAKILPLYCASIYKSSLVGRVFDRPCAKYQYSLGLYKFLVYIEYLALIYLLPSLEGRGLYSVPTRITYSTFTNKLSCFAWWCTHPYPAFPALYPIRVGLMVKPFSV